MTATPPVWNLLDFPWVPLTRPDGNDTLATVAQTLTDAHTHTSLSSSLLPMERDGLHQFLTALTAVVLRDLDDPESVLDDRTIPADAVTNTLTRYRDAFWLDHPTRPFMGEWDYPADQWTDDERPNISDPAYLLLRVPGGSTSEWGRQIERRDPYDIHNLPLVLITLWYHATRSNGGGIKRRGAPRATHTPIARVGGSSAEDTTIHVLGSTLAETILANIQTDWLTEDTLPVWLDQHQQHDLPHLVTHERGMWRATYSPDRVILAWHGCGLAGAARVVTRQPAPALPVTHSAGNAAIANAALRVLADATKSAQHAKASLDLNQRRAQEVASFSGYHLWFPRKNGGRGKYVFRSSLASAAAVIDWWAHEQRVAAHLASNLDSRLLPTYDLDETARFGIHVSDGDPTSGMVKVSDWHEVPLNRLVLPGTQAAQAANITGLIVACIKTGYPILDSIFTVGDGQAKGRARPETEAAHTDFKTRSHHTIAEVYYSALDAISRDDIPALTRTLPKITRALTHAFDATVAVYASPLNYGKTENAKAQFARSCARRQRTLLDTITSTPTEGTAA